MANCNKNEFSDLVDETLSEDELFEGKPIKSLAISLSVSGERLESDKPFFFSSI